MEVICECKKCENKININNMQLYDDKIFGYGYFCEECLVEIQKAFMLERKL